MDNVEVALIAARDLTSELLTEIVIGHWKINDPNYIVLTRALPSTHNPLSGSPLADAPLSDGQQDANSDYEPQGGEIVHIVRNDEQLPNPDVSMSKFPGDTIGG